MVTDKVDDMTHTKHTVCGEVRTSSVALILLSQGPESYVKWLGL